MTDFNLSKFFKVIVVLCVVSAISLIYAQDVLKTEEVIVEGIGVSADAAKKNAFRNAVGKVVGSFIENDTLIKNDKIIEEKLLEYSGGFVETFEIVSEGKDKDGLFKVKLKVKVAQQTVAEKLRSMKIDVKTVSGSNLKAQLETQETMKKDGGKLINSIMEEYPKLWQAKQIAEPKIANGKLALEIEVSVDREKYLAWAEKLCKVLEKTADCTTMQNCRKDGSVANYDKTEGRSREDNWHIVSVDLCYYRIDPGYVRFKKATGRGVSFSVVREFSQGNYDLQSFLFYESNPLFNIIGTQNEVGKACRNYLQDFLPNKLEIKIQDSNGGSLLKETVKKAGFSLWDAFNTFAIGGDLFAVTPFAIVGGLDETSSRSICSIKGVIKADLPIDGIDVAKVSKIATGFIVEK